MSDRDGGAVVNPEEGNEEDMDGKPKEVAERKWVPEREPSRCPIADGWSSYLCGIGMVS